ncbi:DUF551 domain-containing protein [Salmonella enterica subsp. enterica serovar Onderstepoort]|nr:DUF551 domain-containing protein [Salmonella enterica subsp. enterica serovar Onderstepoort]
MTTITKERIELFIKNPLENGLTRGEQMELARIAMASLEAEPIGAFHIADQQVGGTSDYIKDGEWPIDNGVIDVYAVPPVLVVPEERPSLNNGIVGFDEGWNACRAAMLHGCSNFDVNGNSPVSPGSWISCSERMPDREYVLAGDFSGTHYLASIPNVQVGIYADWFDDEKPCWDDGDGNDLHLKEVTHWMPLPEPPQQ